MRHLALLLLATTACSSAGEKNTPAAGVASASTVPGTSTPAAGSSNTPAPSSNNAAPYEDPAVVKARRTAALATYQARAADRERLPDAYGSAIIQLALVRKNGGSVDDDVVQSLWKRLKSGVCFGEPKLSIIDRTKTNTPLPVIDALRTGAVASLESTRAKCPNGKQPLTLSIRIDSFDEVSDHESDTRERTVSATGELATDGRVFPFKVREQTRDRGNADKAAPRGLHVPADESQANPMSGLRDQVVQRIVVIVGQALDRHLEGLRKAYATMAIQTTIQDDGASQEHHALEVVALGGRIDENPTLAQKLAERYQMSASDLAAAVAALHLD